MEAELPVVLSLRLDEHHFHLWVGKEIEVAGPQADFGFGGTVEPGEHGDFGRELAAEGGVPPGGKGHGADLATLRHAANMGQGRLGVGEAGGFVEGDVIGGKIAAAGEGHEQFGAAAFHDEGVGLQSAFGTKGVEAGEGGSGIGGREVFHVEPKTAMPSGGVLDVRTETEVEGGVEVVGDIEAPRGFAKHKVQFYVAKPFALLLQLFERVATVEPEFGAVGRGIIPGDRTVQKKDCEKDSKDYYCKITPPIGAPGRFFQNFRGLFHFKQIYSMQRRRRSYMEPL